MQRTKRPCGSTVNGSRVHGCFQKDGQTNNLNNLSQSVTIIFALNSKLFK
ncbi:MAG: hypothetical protein JST52_07820 [Bacteroidetes bacterium]|nr:hypothetical protein [Bacteroidota bacterium]MBS1739702.1 hypothetical protein [Bacteroidota bacterium]